MLREAGKRLKKPSPGDDIDIDDYADVRSALALSERLFTKKCRHERNMAVMFTVDMSGSTKAWINDAEREAPETLSDRYAIYGFPTTRATSASCAASSVSTQATVTRCVVTSQASRRGNTPAWA